MDSNQVLATLPDRFCDLPSPSARDSLLVQGGVSMTPTPEELARLIPEFCEWNGHPSFRSPIMQFSGTRSKEVLSACAFEALLTDRRTLERYRGVMGKLYAARSEPDKLNAILMREYQALSKED